MLLFVCVANFFRQPSKATIPFLIFCVSNTLAQDNREHLLSCGRIRTLLAMMSFMHACLGKGGAVCDEVRGVFAYCCAVALRICPATVDNKHSMFFCAGVEYVCAGQPPRGIPYELFCAVLKQHDTKPD